jgi:hypothetical protein
MHRCQIFINSRHLNSSAWDFALYGRDFTKSDENLALERAARNVFACRKIGELFTITEFSDRSCK